MKIQDVCEVVRGSSPRPQGDSRYFGGKIPRLMVADVTRDGMYVTPRIDSLTEEGAARSRPMKAGDLVIAVSGAPGLPAILKTDACIHDGFVGLRNLDHKRVNTAFLYRYLDYVKTQSGNGAVGAIFKNLTTDQIRGLEIPLPPLSEQQRIADILNKADAIRRKRQQVVEVIATSYKSLFVSMFGDPVENHRGLPVKTIAELTMRISKGESPKWQGFDYQDDGVQFITSENVRWGHLDTTTPKFIPHAFHTKLERSQLAKDDLLINLVGASVGRTALVPESELPANVNQAVAVVSLDRKQMLPTFLLHQLLNDRMQRVLLGNAVESARANISLTNIRDTSVLVPNIDEQQAWHNTVLRTANLSESAKCAWQECDDLFNSLVQCAFKGEL